MYTKAQTAVIGKERDTVRKREKERNSEGPRV